MFDEYVHAGRKLTPPEEFLDWEAGVRALYEEMVRIDITPTWAKIHDFERRIPAAVERLVERSSASETILEPGYPRD